MTRHILIPVFALCACAGRAIPDSPAEEPLAAQEDDEEPEPDQQEPEEEEDEPEDVEPEPEPDEPPFMAEGGTFTLTAQDVTSEPHDCRPFREGVWTLELPVPPAKGPWTAVETFDDGNQAFSNKYDCTGTADAFECVTHQGHDYNQHGMSANVELVVTYEGRWAEADVVEGSFDLLFSCDGSACDDVAGQWTVTGFPCANSGQFTGDRS